MRGWKLESSNYSKGLSGKDWEGRGRERCNLKIRLSKSMKLLNLKP